MLTAVAVIITGLIVLPYPLKVEVTGKAIPQVRRTAYVPAPGMITQFDVLPNEQVGEGRSLAQMYDSSLWSQLNKLVHDMEAAKMEADETVLQAEKETNPAEKLARRGRAALKRAEQNARESVLLHVVA